MSLIRMFSPLVNTTKRCITLNTVNEYYPQLCGVISKCMINTFERIALNSVPSIPKRPLNAYFLYSNEAMPTIVASNPNMPVKQLTKIIGEKWKSLPEHVKQVYSERAKVLYDKYRIEREKVINTLTPQQLEQLRVAKQMRIRRMARIRLKTALKSLNYPIRPRSSFAFYIRDAFSESKNNEPNVKIFAVCTERWKSLSEDQKMPYFNLAKQDKLRYLEQMESWKKELAKPENKDSLKNIIELRAKGYVTIGTVLKGEDKLAKAVAKKKKKTKSASKKMKAKKVVSQKTKLSKRKLTSKVKTKRKTTKDEKEKKVESESQSD